METVAPYRNALTSGSVAFTLFAAVYMGLDMLGLEFLWRRNENLWQGKVIGAIVLAAAAWSIYEVVIGPMLIAEHKSICNVFVDGKEQEGKMYKLGALMIMVAVVGGLIYLHQKDN